MRTLNRHAAATGLMLLLATVAASASIYRAAAGSRGRPRSPVQVERAWRDYAVRGHSWGPSDADLVATEFSDFQCPFCRRYAAYVDSLLSLGYRVRQVYRHTLSAAHPHALGAALAFECAGQQGRAREMYEVLHAGTDSLGKADWWMFAARAGVSDSSRFAACSRDPETRRLIVVDSLASDRLGVRGTPVVLLNHVRLNGLPSFDSLRIHADRALSQSRTR
jgi:protein-disulfide isomerase